MKVYGKVYKVLKKERLISIIVNNKLEFYHMTNKNMKEFKAYLYKTPYVSFDCSDIKTQYDQYRVYEINYFEKILVPSRSRSKVYYDLNIIRDGLRQIINKPINRLFLDLEFSLPSYGNSHIEILQYGMIVEDHQGNIILEKSSLLKPLRKNSLNQRTLNFLNLEYKDFNDAPSYIEFYQLLQKAIKDYDVKIIAWGKNDILALEQSFKTNHLQPLDVRSRYINLMQIIKNFYNQKQEIGLFATYQEFSNQEPTVQSHNAFEDATIAREIFHIFKSKIN